MRKLQGNAKQWALLLIHIIPRGISCKVWSPDKVLNWREKGPLFPSSMPSSACPQYISEYNNPLGRSHSYKVSLPAYKMSFQIKLLFFLIKLHIWAKTVTLIQLNYCCLQLCSEQSSQKFHKSLRCPVKQTPTRQQLVTKGDTTLFQQHASFRLQGQQCELCFPAEILSSVITMCILYEETQEHL